eukprot:11313204-Ditylum_brightwellii.AAC.1
MVLHKCIPFGGVFHGLKHQSRLSVKQPLLQMVHHACIPHEEHDARLLVMQPQLPMAILFHMPNEEACDHRI